jgi:O-antigen/teichoic acid export membrane protein
MMAQRIQSDGGATNVKNTKVSRMRKPLSLAIATGMSLFGLAILYFQIFAWHHLRVWSVIAAAMLSIGFCIIYDHLLSRPRARSPC